MGASRHAPIEQPFGAVHEHNVSRTGQHRELGTWEAGDTARHGAVEQSKHLYACSGRTIKESPIMIQRGSIDRLNASGGQSLSSRSPKEVSTRRMQQDERPAGAVDLIVLSSPFNEA